MKERFMRIDNDNYFALRQEALKETKRSKESVPMYEIVRKWRLITNYLKKNNKELYQQIVENIYD